MNPQNNNNRYNGYSVRLVQRQSQERLLAELVLSYYSARSGKRNSYAQVRFERDLATNLMSLFHDILERRYKVGRSMCFIVDRPVKREVFAASFRDRVVHHLLYRYLAPVFEPTFIHDSYSCRKGRGTSFGIARLEHHIRSVSDNYTRPCWVLKLDLEGYFMNIDRSRLYDIIVCGLRAKGKHLDPDYPWMDYLLRQVVFNEPTRGCYRKGQLSDWEGLPSRKSLFYAREGCGLPIGNLTSQLFSNIYLNGFDQWVKRELKCRHYGRYVDDFYVVDSGKERLLSLIPRMQDFLVNRLGLHIHPGKVYLQPASRGVPFLGVVLRPGRHRVSPRTLRLARLHVAESFADIADPYRLSAMMASYNGLGRELSGFRIRRSAQALFDGRLCRGFLFPRPWTVSDHEHVSQMKAL